MHPCLAIAGISDKQRLFSTLGHYSKANSGNVAVIAAICMTLIMAATGGAVDFGRAYQARIAAQNTLDAAVLAAGRALQTSQSETDAIAAATNYYDAIKSGSIANTTPSFTIEGNKTIVRGSVTGQIDTFVLGLIDLPKLTISVDSFSMLAGGSTSGTNYELALMLDVTGSMCDDGQGPCTSGTKINALKAAATDLVNIVVWDNQSTYTSRAAIVPFSTRIRIAPNGAGSQMMKRLTNLNATFTGWEQLCTAGSGSGSSETNGSWVCTASASTPVNNWRVMPCVTDRTGPQEFTDASPGPSTWLNGHGGDRMPVSVDSSDTTPTMYLGNQQSDPSYNWNYFPNAECADVDNGNEVLPLTADKAALNARIQAMSAYGSTSGALGTAWAWYMLSPNWSTVWTGATAPASYGDLTTMIDGRPLLKKVAVLMTDGDYNTYRGWKDSDQNMVSTNAKTICTNMKNAGIEIYTVGFGLDLLPSDKRALAEATLKSCGTDINHFYNAFNAAELQGAFRDIAVKLAVLRLSK